MNQPFKLVSKYQPAGDQEAAIKHLTKGIEEGDEAQVLLGVTGSGKTFTIANVIQNVNKPTLVIAHNKTLAAQLYSEFKEFFPENHVEYFVSYYDYYQPEAYVPSTDTYIEKDAAINDEIDKLRHSATASILECNDTIIVASVSCIYGLGDPSEYKELVVSLRPGMKMDRDEILKELVRIQYDRNDLNFIRGTFRVRGDSVEVFPISEAERAIRIELFGDEIEKISEIEVLTGKVIGSRNHVYIYPASHYVVSDEKLSLAIRKIEDELQERLTELKREGKLVEEQRLRQRVTFDIEMMREMGYCTGIENYSRHLAGRAEGEIPATLMDFFPEDFLLVIDESHMTVPQIRGMYNGDRARKTTLVDFGFRLPSALDNRPLNFREFANKINQVIFVSATPAEYEKEVSDQIVEQIIRPTGLIDPEVEVRKTEGQIDDLLFEIHQTIQKQKKVFVTTLTKKMSEDLTDYLDKAGIKVRYLHSEVDTLERVKIIRDLRMGKFDVLVGINLLREGLDVPEVSLVAILDADKEGFLRSETALIQTIGRAARNVDGKVIMYADRITDSMDRAIKETERRRKIQAAHNEKHHIIPKSITKEVRDLIQATVITEEEESLEKHKDIAKMDEEELKKLIQVYKKEMQMAAKYMEFEEAATYRDKIIAIEDRLKKRK